MKDLKPIFEKAYPAGFKGGECGTFAHNLVQFPPVGDLLTQKIAAVKKYGSFAADLHGVFLPGDVVIFIAPPDKKTKKTYGHVAVINCVYSTAFRLTESNYHLDKKVTHTRKVLISSPKIAGVIRGKLKIKT